MNYQRTQASDEMRKSIQDIKEVLNKKEILWKNTIYTENKNHNVYSHKNFSCSYPEQGKILLSETTDCQ